MSSVKEVLRCPACNTSSLSIAMKEQDQGKFLYCESCKRKFAQDRRDSFFNFFAGENKSEGSLLAKSENMLFTNRHFKDLYFKTFNSNLRAALQKCSAGVLVDIGCGGGGYAVALEGLYEQYYGFEPSPIPDEMMVGVPAFRQKLILLHYDTTKKLPIQNNSVDLAALIASYDHIPDARGIIEDIYTRLKDNGYLVIVMKNCNFWARKLASTISAGKLCGQESEHYRAHSPGSLIKEIESFVNMKTEAVRADFFFLPNLPKALSFIYFSERAALSINSLSKHILSLFGKRNCGSIMIVVFRKIS